MKPKYHIVISCLLVACLVMLAYSKKSEMTKSIRWGERLLQWDDFPLIDAIEGNYHAMVYSNIQFEGSREENSLRIYAQMIPHLSGRVLEDDNDLEQLLIHEQNHFNITEYHARLFRKEAIVIGKEKLSNNDLQRLGKKYLAKIDAMQDKYDEESKHNTQWPQQRYWELYVAGLLRETAYYAEEDLYSYQAFTNAPSSWYRQLYANLEGKLLPSYPELATNSHYGNIYKIEKKQDSTIVTYYKNGKPTNGGYYEAAVCIITFPNATTRDVFLFDADGKPFSNVKEAYHSRTLTDTQGNITRTYYDDKGKQVSKEGVYTQKGIWNAAQKSMHSSYYDKDGNPVTRRGAYQELREMGENGVSKRISYFDRAGKPMRDKYFISIYEYESDDNFMITTAHRKDVDGKYAIGVEGYISHYEYDERGQIKSVKFLDSLGNKWADNFGIHQYTYIYDRYDNCTDMHKFNIRGLASKGMDDFHQSVNLYDTLGRITFSAKYYPNYVLAFTETKGGATTYEYLGDSIVNVRNVDVYGDEALQDTGIYLTKQFLNAKKEVVEEQYFGTEETWAKTIDGTVSYKYKYDERGNQVEIAAFDSLGNPHAWVEDVSITRWEYDKNNNKVKSKYYTVNNTLANGEQDINYSKFRFDDNHNILERSNYDKNNIPGLYDGVYRTVCVLNRFEKDSIVTMYNTHSQIIDGSGIIKYDYNIQGYAVAERYYNERNQPVLNDFGIHKTVYTYDKFNRYTGYTYYGIKGEKVNSIEGISSMETQLNPSGYSQQYSYFDRNKKPVIGPEGFHRLENHYNDMDEVVRSSTYGTDQKLINNAEGVADYVYQIDKSGRTLRVSLYNANGDLTENSSGIAEYFYSPELNGLFYLEKQLNAKGEEIPEEAL